MRNKNQEIAAPASETEAFEAEAGDATELLPAAGPAHRWTATDAGDNALGAEGGTFGAGEEALGAEPGTEDEPAAEFALPPADESFVPKPRYTVQRSTKILVCVALVMAGAFGGALVQKGVDAGNRSARTNFSNFQNQQQGTGTTSTPGQSRRNGGQGGTGQNGSTAPASNTGN